MQLTGNHSQWTLAIVSLRRPSQKLTGFLVRLVLLYAMRQYEARSLSRTYGSRMEKVGNGFHTKTGPKKCSGSPAARSGTLYYKPDLSRSCCPHYTIR